ncbi:hypothetical protein GbCGDNIH6_8000 [Granulibacter bethesdensis]|uniref:Uncharacterized protein n=1 Tax=Granulibacter bethesdensis (strain ATCC BAA-1260 / CGDNIH1) TaxID=391165 RepID=A0A286M2T2_GRABC|nr:hypothetical protein GbCGDNIH5_8000 [Granulibacter bethesdensis]APH55787.1 hypothetical protein GbCGDNIH6_8000 [Granulibacter bethesdensis]APH58298.1 hypothetical protein GbCGDNIH7_8000 [Granulibacter bethesdensis]APH63373.1 hypothetical protein GbCGDNIH1I4_8000 [Granulibacter bethesdensis]ASV62331.1 hypothetical protein GbCGDNIH1_8000 [Granulibacter bethesdensis CGDNIH1]
MVWSVDLAILSIRSAWFIALLPSLAFYGRWLELLVNASMETDQRLVNG